MDKKEFLDVLRQFLNGEVSSDIIEQNIRYYDQYISSKSKEEEASIIEMLGDPRLIAKTVIETDKASKNKNSYQEGNRSENSYGKYSGSEEEGYQQNNKNSRNNRNTVFHTNLTWRQKATLILVLIVVIFILLFIGRIIIGFLFTFGVPILLILLLYALFRKRN